MNAIKIFKFTLEMKTIYPEWRMKSRDQWIITNTGKGLNLKGIKK